MLKISAVIITLNEERNLNRCLESLEGIADEIIIVDSYSTDRTVQIGAMFGAKIINKNFLGYGAQKQFATDQASNDWVISLDADEAISTDLKKSLLLLKEKGVDYDAYKFSRLNNYCGKWIRHCGWYPDFQTRLFNRKKGSWKLNNVHEYWQLNDLKAEIGLVLGDLLHYTFSTIAEHSRQIEKFASLAAKDAVKKGKKASFWKVWAAPKWYFIQKYFFQLGILDGYYGYVICKLSAHAKWLRYNLTRTYYKEKKGTV
jgi:glycosyltransferase involved in cell wall biosynthesis